MKLSFKQFIYFVAFVLLTTFTLSTAQAEVNPKGYKSDKRIRAVRYTPNNVIRIEAATGTSTMLVLHPNEKIETLAVGDSVAWQVTPNKKGNIIFIKPLRARAETNLNVVTNQRLYTFILTAVKNTRWFKISMKFPGDAVNQKALELAKKRAATPSLSSLDKATVNTNYSYKGNDNIKPSTIFDDGKKTYFQFTDKLPAFFWVDEKQNEHLVNFRREGDFIIVDKVAKQWTLRSGDTWTCLYNLERHLTNTNTLFSPKPLDKKVAAK